MAKLTILYGHPEDPAAFEEYYANTHNPLVEDIPNLRRFEAVRLSAQPTKATTLLLVSGAVVR